MEQNTCVKSKLFLAYIRHAKLQGVNRRAIETAIGMFLSKCVGPDLETKRMSYVAFKPDGESIARRGWSFRFPPLKTCRERFARELKQDIAWNQDNTEWQHDDEVVTEVNASEEEIPF